MPFTRKQDSLLTCRDQQCAKSFSTVGNCTCYKKKFGFAQTITIKTKRLLYNETTKLHTCPNEGCSSTFRYNRSKYSVI